MKKGILLLAALIAACSIIPAFALAQDEALPQLSAVSTIFGSGDTGGKTTVKHILVTAAGPGDSAFNTGDYVFTDVNSGREWSILGGDGNGCFTFNFGVSGITYDGQPVNDASFKVQVYIWGRTGTDVAPAIADVEPENHLPSGQQPGAEVQ